MKRAWSLVLSVGASACAPARPALEPAAPPAEEVRAPTPAAPLARLRLGPVADGAVGPLVVDEGERTAMLLAQPIGEGRFRVTLAIEGEGPALVRTIAETSQTPRGFALALGERGGVAAWIEGERRNATVSAVVLNPEGAPLAPARRLPQGRVEPYWVAVRVDGAQRRVVVAEQDATGALLRVRTLGDDGEPTAAPTTLARGAAAWATHAEIPLAVVRAAGREARLEAFDPSAREPLVAAGRVEGVSLTAVRRLDVAGVGAGRVYAVSVHEPRREVIFLREGAGGALLVAGRTDGQVVAADVTGAPARFLVAKAFPSSERGADLALVRVEATRVDERTLPERVSDPRAGGLPPSLAAEPGGAVVVALGADNERPAVLRVGASGAVDESPLESGVGSVWNARLRAGIVRVTRFEARGAGVDLVDGPLVTGAARSLGKATPRVDGVVTYLPTSTGRVASALLGDTSFALRLEPASAEPADGDLNAESLRLTAIAERAPAVDDRLSDRAQPTGSIHLAAARAPEAAIVATWTAREKGVQQGHALVLDARACSVQACALPAGAWPLPRRKHRQITKAGGDVTEIALVPTPEGYVGAWIEQSGREAAVVAATYDRNLERTSRLERVSAAGSLATDLAVAVRGASAWVGWIEGKGGTAADPRAVPTVARVAVHDARVELKPQALTTSDGLGGALALAPHESGLLVGFVEREGSAAARVADEAEGTHAFFTLLVVDDRGAPTGDAYQRGADGEGVPCDLALTSTTFALERCRPGAFSLEFGSLTATKDGGVRADAPRTVARGLRPATQDRPLAIDDRRVLWLQNDEAGNPWLRGFPLGAPAAVRRAAEAADQK
jgi:hypothetical protein